MNDERCELFGTDKDRHYDGVKCPDFAGSYSSTQKFTPTRPKPMEDAPIGAEEMREMKQGPCERRS